jgi:hypothetical protein
VVLTVVSHQRLLLDDPTPIETFRDCVEKLEEAEAAEQAEVERAEEQEGGDDDN